MVIIVLPNVLGMFNDAKKNTFETGMFKLTSSNSYIENEETDFNDTYCGIDPNRCRK